MVELKSRLDTLMPEGMSAVSLAVGSVDCAVGREAEDALIALGYKLIRRRRGAASLRAWRMTWRRAQNNW